MTRLLGYLARFGSLISQGEVLCTQGLAHLLREHPEAGSALTAEISSRSGIALQENLRWRAEVCQEIDGGRPDLEGCAPDNVTQVKIEAKLGASFSEDQLRSYVHDLRDRSRQSAFVLLVPRRRVREATERVTQTFNLSGQDPWRIGESPDVAITILSWEDLLVVLGKTKAERLHRELEQFESMFDVLNRSIEPLAGRADLLRWREIEHSKGTFTALVDRVTRQLTTHHNLYPMGVEPLEQVPADLEPTGYRRRYVCQPLGVSGSSTCFSIGVRDPFARGDTPIWLRFHHETAHFEKIRVRLEASDLFKPLLVRSGGSIWLPLDLPHGAGEDEMVRAILDQTHQILHVAFEPSPPV